jgi:hypothetical protein
METGAWDEGPHPIKKTYTYEIQRPGHKIALVLMDKGLPPFLGGNGTAGQSVARFFVLIQGEL